MGRPRKNRVADANAQPLKNQTPSQSEAQKAEQDAKLTSPVQPIEVIRGNPEEGNEEAETVIVNNKPNLQESGTPIATANEENRKSANKMPGSSSEPCWNCATDLDGDGVCDNCGFEMDKLYNGTIEARKAAERAAQQY